MDTESIGYNLSNSQFGVQYLRDHHEALNLAEPQPGAINGQVDEPKRPGYASSTGRRKTFRADDTSLIPNQTHVHSDKVRHYVENPSDRPIFVVPGPEGTHVLDGHHRLVANRILGRPTKAEIYRVKG